MSRPNRRDIGTVKKRKLGKNAAEREEEKDLEGAYGTPHCCSSVLWQWSLRWYVCLEIALLPGSDVAWRKIRSNLAPHTSVAKTSRRLRTQYPINPVSNALSRPASGIDLRIICQDCSNVLLSRLNSIRINASWVSGQEGLLLLLHGLSFHPKTLYRRRIFPRRYM